MIYDGPITDSAAAIIIKQDPMLVDSLTKVAIGTKINITLSNKQQ
jgi:type III secretion system FlhB-like substrate exporter